MKSETVAVHAGHCVDPTTGAIASPIYQGINYTAEVVLSPAR